MDIYGLFFLFFGGAAFAKRTLVKTAAPNRALYTKWSSHRAAEKQKEGC